MGVLRPPKIGHFWVHFWTPQKIPPPPYLWGGSFQGSGAKTGFCWTCWRFRTHNFRFWQNGQKWKNPVFGVFSVFEWFFGPFLKPVLTKVSNSSKKRSKQGYLGRTPFWPKSGEICDFVVLDVTYMCRKSRFLAKPENLAFFGQKGSKLRNCHFWVGFGQEGCFLTPKIGHFWAPFGRVPDRCLY